MRRTVRIVQVRALVGDRARGLLITRGAALRCALGPAGILVDKREGDGGTPRGALRIRRLWLRADRGPRPVTNLPVRTIRRRDGWCDAVGHSRYNQLVELPFSASHETMWRDDRLYDLVLELGWNDAPVRQGRGSAIFLHAARPGFTPTAGCVAIEPAALRRLVARLGPETVVRIGSVPGRPRRPKD